jgi:hypothetical protein
MIELARRYLKLREGSAVPGFSHEHLPHGNTASLGTRRCGYQVSHPDADSSRDSHTDPNNDA